MLSQIQTVFITMLVFTLIIFICTSTSYNHFDVVEQNYKKILDRIEKSNAYKKQLSVSLHSIPTVLCNVMKDKKSCNENGCNWYGNICSSMYPYDY